MVTFRKNKKEVEDFLDFLLRIAEKRKGENVSTLYQGYNTSCRFLLVGKRNVILKYGLAPYVNRIKKDMNNGVHHFFLIATGRINCPIASLVAEKVVRDGIAKLKDVYDGEIYIRNDKKRVFVGFLENNLKL